MNHRDPELAWLVEMVGRLTVSKTGAISKNGLIFGFFDAESDELRFVSI